MDLRAGGRTSSLGDEAGAVCTARWVLLPPPLARLLRRRQREVSTMASTGNPSGGPVRRVAILGRVVQLGRGRRAPDAGAQAHVAAHERRIKALEERIDHLEALLEGLQDAVHREFVRDEGRLGALEKRSEPSEVSRALNQDARERGL
jgi:hypothetical protein